MRVLPCNMDKLITVASKYNLKIHEDVAQVAGGTYKGKLLGSFGGMGLLAFRIMKKSPPMKEE